MDGIIILCMYLLKGRVYPQFDAYRFDRRNRCSVLAVQGRPVVFSSVCSVRIENKERRDRVLWQLI